MWVAKDKKGAVCIYNVKPTKDEYGDWFIKEDTGSDNPNWGYLQLTDKEFDHISTNEPIEVRIVPSIYNDIDGNYVENMEFMCNPYTFEKDGAKVVGAYQSGFMKGIEVIYDLLLAKFITNSFEWMKKHIKLLGSENELHFDYSKAMNKKL